MLQYSNVMTGAVPVICVAHQPVARGFSRLSPQEGDGSLWG